MSDLTTPLIGLPVLGAGEGATRSRSTTKAATPVAEVSKPVQLFVNPSFRFDPSVGLVVIEFHNDIGKVENSIPSQRQLAAYRNHQAALPGEQDPAAAKLADAGTANPAFVQPSTSPPSTAPPASSPAVASPTVASRTAIPSPGDGKTPAG
jgi:hypothetical protein